MTKTHDGIALAIRSFDPSLISRSIASFHSVLFKQALTSVRLLMRDTAT